MYTYHNYWSCMKQQISFILFTTLIIDDLLSGYWKVQQIPSCRIWAICSPLFEYSNISLSNTSLIGFFSNINRTHLASSMPFSLKSPLGSLPVNSSKSRTPKLWTSASWETSWAFFTSGAQYPVVRLVLDLGEMSWAMPNSDKRAS